MGLSKRACVRMGHGIALAVGRAAGISPWRRPRLGGDDPRIDAVGPRDPRPAGGGAARVKPADICILGKAR